MMNIQTLRILSCIEGISFLLLLFIAMPAKYMWGNPILVKYIGMGHGLLFMALIALLLIVCQKYKWPNHIFMLGFVAAVLPFGPFLFDKKLKEMM